jgi:hypothetical protein
MSRRDWTELCLKLFALFLLIRGLAQLPSFFAALLMNTNAVGIPGALFLLTGLLVPLLAALLLWHSAPSLSGRIWASPTAAQDLSPASVSDVQTVLFSAIGLYVLVTSVPALLQTVVAYQQVKALGGAALSPTVVTQHWTRALELGLKVALSLWLLLGSQAIVHLVQRARSH